ncbi:MAG: PAS domain-containing protein [Devosia sp.]
MEALGRFQLALDAGRIGTWSTDLASGMQVWSPRQYSLFGLPEDTPVTSAMFMAMVEPADRPRVDLSPEDLAPGRRHEAQFRIRRTDGEIRWLAAHSLVRTNEQGAAVEIVGVTWDITDSKRSEASHLEAERRLALATEAAQIGVWDWDIASGEFFYSPKARSLYGFSSHQEITYEILRNRTHPDDYAQIEPILARALDPAKRTQETYRYRITRADDGRERWLLAHGGAVFSSDAATARPERYTGTLQDITDEVETEAKLVDEQARLSLAIGAADLAVWELSVATNTITPSRELNRLYRFPEHAQPDTEEFMSLYAPGERARVERDAADSVAAGNPTIRFEAKHQWPDGVEKWIGVRAQVLFDKDGQPTRVIGVAMDVTERRMAEDLLRLTARELQHRVKNNLAVVQSLAGLSLRANRPIEQSISVFSDRLRALAVATDLLTRGNWRDVSIRELVDEVVGPHQEDERERIVVTGDDSRVDGSAALALGMALHELCTNAVKYGALSTPQGQVLLNWATHDGTIRVDWEERGGPPVEVPSNTGFGMKLLRGLFTQSHGTVATEFRPEGLVCHLTIAVRGSAVDPPPPTGQSNV